MKVTRSFLGALIVIIMLGGIFAAKAVDLWNTQTKGGQHMQSSGGIMVATKPEDIRGSHRFIDVSNQFGIPIEILLQSFGMENHPLGGHIRNGDLEDFYEKAMGLEEDIGNGSVKLFVALYKGFTYKVDEPTFLPQPAVEVLLDKGISDEWKKYILDHIIPLKDVDKSYWENIYQELPKENLGKLTITGTTTFRDLLNAGINQIDIETAVGGSMPNQLMTVKGYCEQKGISFGQVKGQLENIQY